MKILAMLLLMTFSNLEARAETPPWTFTPFTATTITVPPAGSATVQYQVTNQTGVRVSLEFLNENPNFITQLTAGVGICPNPMVLNVNASCVLSLNISGSGPKRIIGGPVLCYGESLCYQPALLDQLNITIE